MIFPSKRNHFSERLCNANAYNNENDADHDVPYSVSKPMKWILRIYQHVQYVNEEIRTPGENNGHRRQDQDEHEENDKDSDRLCKNVDQADLFEPLYNLATKKQATSKRDQ